MNINHDADIERRFFQLDRLTSMSEAAKRAYLMTPERVSPDEIREAITLVYLAAQKERMN